MASAAAALEASWRVSGAGQLGELAWERSAVRAAAAAALPGPLSRAEGAAAAVAATRSPGCVL